MLFVESLSLKLECLTGLEEGLAPARVLAFAVIFASFPFFLICVYLRSSAVSFVLALWITNLTPGQTLT